MSNIPNIITGKEMKALMACTAKSGNMSLPLFYNGKIYVTDSFGGIVTVNPTINSLDKEKIYQPAKEAFDKILVKNEYYFIGNRLAVSTKDDTDYFELKDVTDTYVMLVSELDSILDEKKREPPENHPTVIGVPADQMIKVANYAFTCGNPYVGSELRWLGAVPVYLYTFSGYQDRYAFICSGIKK